MVFHVAYHCSASYDLIFDQSVHFQVINHLIVSAPPCICIYIQVSQEECEILRESVPYVKLYRYNPKHLYPKLNGYGVNGHRKVWVSVVSTNCTPSVT